MEIAEGAQLQNRLILTCENIAFRADSISCTLKKRLSERNEILKQGMHLFLLCSQMSQLGILNKTLTRTIWSYNEHICIIVLYCKLQGLPQQLVTPAAQVNIFHKKL